MISSFRALERLRETLLHLVGLTKRSACHGAAHVRRAGAHPIRHAPTVPTVAGALTRWRGPAMLTIVRDGQERVRNSSSSSRSNAERR